MDLEQSLSIPIFVSESDRYNVDETSLSSKGDFDEELIPISAFVDELKHDNFEVRLNCVTRLRAVALSVGFENFRSGLLPNLIDILCDDESLLAILAEKLGECVNYIGGKEFIHLLVIRLEDLARWNNIEVQERAVKSLNTIADYMEESDFVKVYLSMILRLASDEEDVVCRLSASQLVISLYGKSPLGLRSFLRNKFLDLQTSRLIVILGIDSSPMVRHEIACNLGSLAKLMHKDCVMEFLLPLHQYLCLNNLEYIKIAALSNTATIAERLRSDVREKYILEVIKNAVEDKSTEIRKTMTGMLCEFLHMFHSKESWKIFVNGFSKLVFDCDPYLRSYAILMLEEFVDKLVVADKLMLIQDLIIPKIANLLSDENVIVRKALASVICSFAKIIPRDRLAMDLYPCFRKLFKDSSEKVRAEIITHFFGLTEIIEPEEIHGKFFHSLIVLGCDSKWTVRLASINFHKQFSMTLGFEHFDAEYHFLFLKWLADDVFVIREKCVQSLGELIRKFGHQCQESFIPKALSLAKTLNYLIRITCVNLLTVLSPFCSKEMNMQKILPTLTKLTQDPVANVRFNVAKAFKVIAPQLDERYVAVYMKPSLIEMINDKDPDVRFFVKDTLDFIESSGTPETTEGDQFY